MNLKKTSNPKLEGIFDNLEIKQPDVLREARRSLAQKVEKTTKRVGSKAELTTLSNAVKNESANSQGEIDPKQKLKDAVIQNFKDGKTAEKVLGETDIARANTLMSKITKSFFWKENPVANEIMTEADKELGGMKHWSTPEDEMIG